MYGIEINYPIGWEKLEFGQNNANGLVVGFVLPREGKPPSEINVSDFILENDRNQEYSFCTFFIFV